MSWYDCRQVKYRRVGDSYTVVAVIVVTFVVTGAHASTIVVAYIGDYATNFQLRTSLSRLGILKGLLIVADTILNEWLFFLFSHQLCRALLSQSWNTQTSSLSYDSDWCFIRFTVQWGKKAPVRNAQAIVQYPSNDWLNIWPRVQSTFSYLLFFWRLSSLSSLVWLS